MNTVDRAFDSAFRLSSLELDGAKPRRSYLCEACVYGRGPKAEWCMKHSEYGDLSIGDMVDVEVSGVRHPATVTEYVPGTWKCRVHPYVLGEDSGWFDAADVQRWRDEKWNWFKEKGIAPQAIAAAIFHGNWR
jgi:hypothetical protein